MWRVPRSSPQIIWPRLLTGKGTRSSAPCRQCKTRLQSTDPAAPSQPPPPPPQPPLPPLPPPRRSGSRTLLKVVGGGALVAGGALAGGLAYAKVSPEFRQQVESNWPLLVPLFDRFLDDQADDNSKASVVDQPPPVKRRPVETDIPSTQQNEVEFQPPASNKTNKDLKEGKTTEPVPVVNKQQAATKPEKKPSQEEDRKLKEAKKKSEKEKQKEEARMKKEEARRQRQKEEEELKRLEKEAALQAEELIKQQERELEAERAAVDAALVGTYRASLDRVSQAIEAQVSARDSIKQHSQQLRQVLDTPGDTEEEEAEKAQKWEALRAAAERVVQTTSAAEEQLNLARESNEKLRSMLQETVSRFKDKRSDKDLLHIQEDLAKMTFDLDKAASEVTSAQAESKLMNEYKDLVQESKATFKRELESITPSVSLGKRKGQKLTEDELNMMMVHAHLKVEQLQRQLAEQQALEQERLQRALGQQKEADAFDAQQALAREKLRQREQLYITFQKKLKESRAEYERELKHQMSRQVGAHTEHLKDVVRARDAQWEQDAERRAHQVRSEEQAQHRRDLTMARAKLTGIELAVEGRADMEKSARQAQEMWHSCEALKKSITIMADLQTGLTKPLDRQLELVLESRPGDHVMETIAQTIPGPALSRGVVTPEGLDRRWRRVRRVCKRVASLDEMGAGPYRYALAYLQSLLIIDEPGLPAPDSQLDPATLGTYQLLAYANSALKAGDIEQAARYVNALRGMAKYVAADWLKEAVLTLEVTQAANVLSAHASASGVGSLV